MSLDVLKVKKDNFKLDLRDANLNPVLAKHSFIQLLIAPPKSGKSNLIGNFLCNSNFYGLDYWDEIIYFSPTADVDKTTNSFLKKMDNVTQISDHESLKNINYLIREIINEQMESGLDNRERKLLVFDDCVGYFDKSDALGDLSTRYRHYSISVLICSQQYRKIPLILRNCATSLIFFNLNNDKEFAKIFDEFGHSFGMDFLSVVLPHLKEPFSFIYLNKEDQKVYSKFDKLLIDKDKH
jgi:hypothetical protein